MRATVNAEFMAEQRKYAEGFPNVGGMMNVVHVTLLPHMLLYRFAQRGTPEDSLYAAFWWVGYSAHEALVQLAGPNGKNLRRTVRERLAVPPEWGNAMDLLVCAHVLKPLSAWSGTPRTARSKDTSTQHYGAPWKPDGPSRNSSCPDSASADRTARLDPLSRGQRSSGRAHAPSSPENREGRRHSSL